MTFRSKFKWRRKFNVRKKKSSKKKKGTSKWSEKVESSKGVSLIICSLKLTKTTKNYRKVKKSCENKELWKLEVNFLHHHWKIFLLDAESPRLKVGRRSTIWIKFCEIRRSQSNFQKWKKLSRKKRKAKKFDKERIIFFLQSMKILSLCVCVCGNHICFNLE